jgi:hypothetical protein
MAKGSGIGSKMAIVAGTRWGSAANANVAGAAIDYISEDFGFAVPEQLPDESVSRSWQGDPIQGNITVNGSVTCYLRYLGVEKLLAYPLGAAAAASLIEAGAYRHKFTYTSNTYGKFATVAIDKHVSVHLYPSTKFLGFTITGQAGRPTNLVARSFSNNNIVPAPAPNNTLGTASYRSQGDHVLWAHQSLLVASKVGAAPTSTTDQYMPASWELVYDQPQAQHWVMNNSAEIIEPIPDGSPNATLNLTFPRYATAPAGTPGNTFAVWGKANTPVKIWLRAVGATITGSTRRRFDLYGVNGFVSSVVSNISNPQAIPQQVTINLKSTTAVPTGLPAWVSPSGGFSIALTNSLATAPF